MYNKSIQLHTSAEQNVTSGYRTVGSIQRKHWRCLRNVHTYATLWYKCTFTISLPLIWSERGNRNFYFGRVSRGGSWRENDLKIFKKNELLYSTKQKKGEETSWSAAKEFMLEIHLYMAVGFLKGQFTLFGVRLYEVLFHSLSVLKR